MRRLAMLVGAIMLAVVMPTATADGLSCGETVTQDVTLTHDLVDCTGDGLIVGASGITIDLGGYTIDGDDDTSLSGGAGIRIASPYNDVAVLKGTITGFSQGVQLDSTTGNNVSRLSATDNVRGIDLANAWGNVIEKNTVTSSALDGIRVNGVASDDNVVRKNVVTGNVFGITASDDADDNLITKNQVSESVYGISVFVRANRTEVSRNDVFDNVVVGIQIEWDSDDAIVARNTVSGNGLGILVKETVSSATVERNDVFGNTGDGIHIGGASGSVDRNDVFDNGGYGINLTVSSSGNSVAFNDLFGNGLGAIIDSGTGNTIL